MSTEGLIILSIVGSFIFIILICGAIAVLIPKISFKHYLKKYPNWVSFITDYNDKSNDLCSWYNENIPSLKRRIDSLEEDTKYLPKAEKEKAETQLESYKEQLSLFKIEYQQKETALKEYYNSQGLKAALQDNALDYFYHKK